jgi:hypothetical protein
VAAPPGNQLPPVTGRPAPGAVDVLLVKDATGDVLLATEAFVHHWAHLHVVGDGEQAIQFLRHTLGLPDLDTQP